MNDLIQRLRSRPAHVRRRIALGVSGAATGLVAIVWLVSGIALGSFDFNSPQQASAVADLGNTFSEATAQSASAFAGVTPLASTSDAGAPASSGGLTIVQTKQSSSIAQVDASDRTIIPF